MKKFKAKIIAGILAVALAGNTYIATADDNVQIQQGITAEVEDGTNGEVSEGEQLDSIVLDRLEEAQQVFETDGMDNLYPKLRRGEKRKWLKLINENSYFESEENLQYQIAGLYKIGENQYYLLGWSTEADKRLTLADYWSAEKEEAHVAEEIFQLVLIQEGESYFVTQAMYPSEVILSSEEVALYKKEGQEDSSVSIEYDKVRKLDGLEDYVGYLDEAIGTAEQETINDSAKGEVTQYVQYAIEDLSSEEMVAEDNTIQVGEDLLEQMKDTITSAKSEFDELLSKNEITFNKSLNSVLRIQTKEINFKEPIYIQLPNSFEDLGEITGLRILLDDRSYVYIDGADLQASQGLKIKIERLKDKSAYEITFLTKNDEVIEQLDYTITFAFPAKDEFSTVLADYAGESQNWGGQYDTSSRTIAFGTKYSGKYKVVDNNVKIKDIGRLPSSQQSAIKFMVSKGYLSLENDQFYPDATFTRYEFAEALVKMFFALDTSLTTTFKDVPADNPYYPYVASGETYDIIKGYADDTFKGDVKIPVEQVLSLCARTIADKKGYVYPESIDEYIKFADSDEIAKWAINDIALAVQSGLVTGGGSLAPKAEITKAESAEILYQLFMMLHETSPDNVVEISPTQKTYSILGVILLALLAIWLIRRFIKKNKVILTMIACTIAVIITLIIGFKGGF